MSRFEAPLGIVTNGLVLNLDAGDPDSYTRSQPPYVEVLVVAGGGGGGSHVGGGGGAGGLLYNSAYQLTSAAAVTVTVGGGGSGGSSDARGSNGSNSVFGSLTAIGGGGGGSWGGAGNPNGLSGGSGGGAAGTEGFQFAIGGTSTAGQGFDGGNVGPRSGTNSSGVGGGGAGGGSLSRADASDATQINGGPGLPFSILGTTYYFSGGGGGGSYLSVAGGNGGAGGGGGGASTSGTPGTGNAQSINAASNGSVGSGAAGGAAATNSGGGGGAGAGGGAGVGAAGGSGIVIVRYPGLPAATGGTITYLNGYTIHTFTTSGTFTPNLWNDVSGNNNSGSLVNGVGFNSYQNGGSLIFDGTDDVVDVVSNFGTYSSYTICYWAVIDAENRMPVAGRLNTQFYWFGDNSWAYTHGGAFGEYYYAKNVSIPLGSWGHLCVVYNGSNVSIYRQGIYQGQQSTTGTANWSQGLKIGYWAGGAGYAWLGKIPVVQFYNRALSAAEITQNYNAQKSRFGL